MLVRALALSIALLVSVNLHANGLIDTYAGNGIPAFGGDDGAATVAELYSPFSTAVDGVGNLYIADTLNHRIRRVDDATGVISTVAGNGVEDYSGDGGAATAASLNAPYGLSLDRSDNLYFADSGNNRIRRVDAVSGVISTVAGNGTAGFSGDGGLATAASLRSPVGVAVDGAGNLYVAEASNRRIRRIDAWTGVISTVAGNGNAGFNGDGGLATAARLSGPTDVAVDSADNLYIADPVNHRIRRVDAASGVISTVAGNGTAGFSGDGGSATAAILDNPRGLALDVAGNLYIIDQGNNRIRRVDLVSGVISTVVGDGVQGFGGDGGLAVAASLNEPAGVVVHGSGTLYIADASNNRIRRVEGVGESRATTQQDFSNDGKADILFREAAGSQLVWTMNGATRTSAVIIGGLNMVWTVVAIDDFDGDGDADILYRDLVTGRNHIWTMNGITRQSATEIGVATANYTVAGTGDFNRDGKADILLRSGGGSQLVWTMDGAGRTGTAIIGGLSMLWSVVAIDDFDGDGDADILYRDLVSGRNLLWTMDGQVRESARLIDSAAPSYTLVGTGDFNGDGKADILFRASDGGQLVWTMNGSTRTSTSLIGGLSASWTVITVDDFDGDGDADILYRDLSTGRNQIWTMNGLVRESANLIGSAATSYAIQPE